MNEQTRIRRIEDAFAKEHDYAFDEGDMAKATHGMHLTPSDAYKTLLLNVLIPIGFVYWQGPHDASPAALWPLLTWSDVSYEEANLVRRAEGSLAGALFSGTPALLAVSVTTGVPTVSITSGGSGYLSGGSGTISLVIAGSCTTQAVRTATVTNGVLTAINVTTAGAGYTSGAVAVYDGVVGHGDLIQAHQHSIATLHLYGGSAGAGIVDQGSGTAFNTKKTNSYLADNEGTPRVGAETSGAWVTVKKWRRTA